jgi:phospholipid/cholesterol/gamma-HCH transport system substrate-binding protein
VKLGRELLVGAVVIVGLAVAVIGSLWLSGAGFGSENIPLEVVVNDIGQLREGNSVKYRGVPLGRVRGFSVVDGGDAVRVQLSLDEAVEMPGDAVALVAPESLFGDWQVEIVSAARYNFPYLDVDSLGVEPTLPGTPVLGGYTIPDISRLTATANEISENLAVLSQRVEEAFTEETADDLRLAIVNLRQISATLRDFTSEQAGSFSEVTDDIRAAAAELGTAARSGRSTLERVDGIMADAQLDSIFNDVELVADNLATITTGVAGSTDEITRALARADSTFARIDRLAARVENGEGLLGQIFADTVLVGRTSSVLAELELLLRDFRQNPSRYVRLSIF